MSAIADFSQHINYQTAGGPVLPRQILTWKQPRIDTGAAPATIAGMPSTLWRYESTYGDGGAVPGAVEAPDRTTQGAMPMGNPSGGRQLWCVGASITASVNGTFLLCDRLLHIGGLSGTATSAQTVGGTITRNVLGAGNLIGLEIETQIGVTSTTVTANYTDDAGNAGQTSSSAAIGATGNREAQRFIIIPMANGDTGCRALASITLAASTSTAGAINAVVFRPLLTIPCIAGAASAIDLLSGVPGPLEIPTDACLFGLWIPNSTGAPMVRVELNCYEA